LSERVAIITGGLRGLGRAMSLGLAETGARVVAVGHIPEDVVQMEGDIAGSALRDRVLPMMADLRVPAECNRVMDATLARFGRVDILLNNAGLTFTYIWPDRYRRSTPPKFWEATDEVIQNVMDTNYVAADQMARRIAPRLVKQGWGRIINVTTKLDTMNVPGAIPYGSSKAALEMATEVWAKEVSGTGLTINVLNPGAGANTLGMAQEMRDRHDTGAVKLVEPHEMVPPLLWLVSPAADQVNGRRFDANLWDPKLPPDEAARRSGRPAGFVLHPNDGEG
jgi:3-oxoacyl-[acyl-carrier protein] reductase